jgi:colicin import membrane protein
MTTANGRNEFAPPPTPGFLRALGLAILAHGLLVAMLTVGVQWKREATPITVEAELWSAVPEQAAPPAPEPATQPEPIPAPPEPPAPVVPPPPVAPVAAPPPPAPTPDADIALAKEKARLKKERLLQDEKREEEKQLKQRQDKLQKEKLEREKEKLDKAARDKKLQAQREQDAKADKAADTAKQKEKEKAAAKTKEEAKKLEELRQQNMKRMAGLAGGGVSGNGDARSTGTAAQSSGPSAGYGGRIRARIKPNITYTEPIAGNPTAEVEVRTSPDGTIISRKLTQSSGVKSWDDAVLSAIDKTEILPRDTDGRVPSSLVISFRPKD